MNEVLYPFFQDSEVEMNILKRLDQFFQDYKTENKQTGGSSKEWHKEMMDLVTSGFANSMKEITPEDFCNANKATGNTC